MSGDDTNETGPDAERFAYLERVEAAARSYADLIDKPHDGPGFVAVKQIEDALRHLVETVHKGVGP